MSAMAATTPKPTAAASILSVSLVLLMWIVAAAVLFTVAVCLALLMFGLAVPSGAASPGDAAFALFMLLLAGVFLAVVAGIAVGVEAACVQVALAHIWLNAAGRRGGAMRGRPTYAWMNFGLGLAEALLLLIPLEALAGWVLYRAPAETIRLPLSAGAAFFVTAWGFAALGIGGVYRWLYERGRKPAR